jgi:DNA-binding MarR family transcriptional regulator
MTAQEKGGFNLDKIIHEHSRLQIVTYLAAGSQKSVSFNELKERLGFSAGNLSVQLRRLEEAGYLQITKTFQDRKPLTTVSITPDGLGALQAYIQELEQIVERMKESAGADGRDQKRL